jgi:hypothetical protein
LTSHTLVFFQQVYFDIDHASLANGRRCEDGIWRQIVTVDDAAAAGCDLYDLDELKQEVRQAAMSFGL